MINSSRENLCIRIARGDITEEGIELTEEEKKEIERLKNYFDELREAGLEGIVKSYCVVEE